MEKICWSLKTYGRFEFIFMELYCISFLQHKYLKILDASCNNITRISGIAENKVMLLL